MMFSYQMGLLTGSDVMMFQSNTCYHFLFFFFVFFFFFFSFFFFFFVFFALVNYIMTLQKEIKGNKN